MNPIARGEGPTPLRSSRARVRVGQADDARCTCNFRVHRALSSPAAIVPQAGQVAVDAGTARSAAPEPAFSFDFAAITLAASTEQGQKTGSRGRERHTQSG